MSPPSEDFEFEEQPSPPKGGRAAQAAKDEKEFYAKSASGLEAGIRFPLPGGGHLCIPDQSGATTVALFVFVVLCFIVVVLIVAGCFSSNGVWVSEVFKVIGQAMLTVVGFLVGSASSAKSQRKRR